jgi:hypothetical protein
VPLNCPEPVCTLLHSCRPRFAPRCAARSGAVEERYMRPKDLIHHEHIDSPPFTIRRAYGPLRKAAELYLEEHHRRLLASY